MFCAVYFKRYNGGAKVYTAALGASVPHFHCHMVPFYEEGGNQTEPLARPVRPSLSCPTRALARSLTISSVEAHIHPYVIFRRILVAEIERR